MRLRYTAFVACLSFLFTMMLTGGIALSVTLPYTQEVPTPSLQAPVAPGPEGVSDAVGTSPRVNLPNLQGAPPLGINWGAFDFNMNPPINGGFLFIPPDPIGAAGPFHVVNVDNCAIEWYTKGGVLQNQQSLASFFAPLGPPLGTTGFDPKVLYDQYMDRFVVVMLERSAADSYFLVAVSKTPDPNLGWWFHAIHSLTPIGANMTWADYPGLAVDDKAIYLTANMFTFPGFYAGERLWIVHKAPFYAGGPATVTQHDAYGAVGLGGYATTTMPTHMYGAPPAAHGTFLISYSGLTAGGPGGIEYVLIINVTDPLGGGGGPFFASQFVPVGDIENVGGIFGFPALPDAPQLGSPFLVEVNDRRALCAVWRNGQLYATATINPNAGPDAGQTTAHWWRLDTTAGIGAIFTADSGNIGAEDVGPGSFTFMPSVTVDKCDNMAVGFAASGPTYYPGAYYTGRLSIDPPGTVQPSGVLMAGMDFYYRTFGGGRNRWGDYSGISIDPTDEATFWVYNEYAKARGTVLPAYPAEDGRWATQWGSFVLGCGTVPVAISFFDARAIPGAVELTGQFAVDASRYRIDIYRGDETVESPVRYKSVEMNGGSEFSYVDREVQPGKTYSYFIAATDGEGEVVSQTREVTVPGVATALHQNEPNPFNPTTTISFDLASSMRVTVAVYDVSGRLVKRLVEGARDAGANHVTWDGKDDGGNRVATGVYIYRLNAGSFSESRKMVLLK